MKKIILWIIVIGLVAATSIYYYVYHFAAKHLDPLASTDKVMLTSEQLFSLYTMNEDSANALYLDKTISITGKVTHIELNNNRYTVTFNSNDSNGAVICEMDTTENKSLMAVSPGSELNVIGFCNGFLMDVQLDRCKLAK